MARLLSLLAAASLLGSASPATTATVAGTGTLVFFSQRNPSGGLYSESAAGGALRELQTGVLDTGALWSPRGRRLLFEVAGTPPWEPQLWIADADGRHKRILALDAGQPSWAPGGRAVAFARRDAIWVLGTDRGRARRLTAPGQKRDSTPRWSPDGRLISFLRTPGGTESTLMVVRPNGTGVRRIAERVFFPPSWSPDGRRIAFDSSGPRDVGTYEPRIYVADATGRHVRRLVESEVNGPVAWSPDGRWIAFGGAGTNAISVARPDGSGLRRLIGADLSSAPVWAPDSRRLAVAAGQPTDVWVAGLDGSSRRVTEGWRYGYSSYSPSWQPRNLRPERLGGTVVSPAIPTDTVVADSVLRATRRVEAIVADGARVVVEYAPGASGCVETWDTQSGALVRFNECGYQGPALAGDRVALPVFEHALGTNSYGIRAATVDHPNASWVSGLCPPPSTQFCIRDPVGDVVGRGSLLVFDSWKGPEPYCNEPCPPPKRDGRLYRVDDGTAVQIASSPAELTPLGVDGGRILVDEGSGTLAVLDATGAALLSVAAPGFTEARLEGPDLVVHSGVNLDDFDAANGALLHTLPIPADATLEDVRDGVAVYVTSSDVHLVRLADGRGAVLTPPGVGPVHAQLEPAGLFYSYAAADPERPGRVAFVPKAALP